MPKKPARKEAPHEAPSELLNGKNPAGDARLLSGLAAAVPAPVRSLPMHRDRSSGAVTVSARGGRGVRSGKVRTGVLLWALGVPIPLILLFLLLRGCMS